MNKESRSNVEIIILFFIITSILIIFSISVIAPFNPPTIPPINSPSAATIAAVVSCCNVFPL